GSSGLSIYSTEVGCFSSFEKLVRHGPRVVAKNGSCQFLILPIRFRHEKAFQLQPKEPARILD
ncbi:unnamed protein product, partial [Nesidiocoris tenuis]